MVLGNDTIIIYEPTTGTDADGSETRSYVLDATNTDSATTVTGCSVQPFLLADKLQVEENRDRAYASTSYRVFAPPGTVVTSDSWVEFQGVIYEAFGFPGPWRDLAGFPHHVEFLMKLRRG